jgi:hypothetical protein
MVGTNRALVENFPTAKAASIVAQAQQTIDTANGPPPASHPLYFVVTKHHEGRGRRDQEYPEDRNAAKHRFGEQRRHHRDRKHDQIVAEHARRPGQFLEIPVVKIKKGDAGEKRKGRRSTAGFWKPYARDGLFSNT